MTASEVEKAAATKSTSPNAKSTSPNAKSTSPNAKSTSPVNKSTSPAAKSASPAKEASPSKAGSPSKEAPVDKKKEALEHFVAGKRHLLVKDLDSAVTSLALASELLSAEHGEAAYECADAYYYYGKALLEMARAEAGVFGNALDGVPDGEDSDNSQVEDPEKMTEEERDDVEKKVGEALDENFDVLEEKRLKKADSTEDETEEEEEESEVAAKEGEEETKKESTEAEKEKSPEKMETEPAKEEKKEEEVKDIADKGTEEEDKKAQEIEEEEDPSNLQLAWEMLELAKVAYTTKLESATPEEKKVVDVKVCETLLLLGEVSLESENYEQAVTDITDCLAKRKVLHAEDSRRIAETHFDLGVALGHFNKFDEAIKSLESSIAVLKKRIANLKEKTESKDESKASDAFYTREAEITEIESLIPEIEEKIQDTKDMKDQDKEKTEESGFSGAAKSDAKPISSISVKRKAEGESTSPTKKAHVQNGN